MQAMKSLMLITVILGLALGGLAPATVHAATASGVFGQTCNYAPDLPGCAPGSQTLDGANNTSSYLTEFTDVFLTAAGLIAVIFLVLGGIRYITSTGDSSRIKAAKDTILYAIIGLIVVILAFPIAGYVIKTVGG